MQRLAVLTALWAATTASGQMLTFASISEFARKTADGSMSNQQFWHALGAGSGPFDCSQRCGVDHQAVGGFVSDTGYEELVKISLEDDARFLLLNRVNDTSTLISYVDAGESRNCPAEAKAVASGGKIWLQIKTCPRGGTGLFLFPSDWYELNHNRFLHVLSVRSEGQMVNGDPARGFETRFIRGETSGDVEMLKFVYSAEFFGGSGSGDASIDINLWQDERIVTFSRKKGEATFQFDPRRSEMSKDYADFIFSEDGGAVYDSPDDQSKFYRLLTDHLLEIARNPHDRRREWLRQLLERKRDVSSLEPVRKAFANAP